MFAQKIPKKHSITSRIEQSVKIHIIPHYYYLICRGIGGMILDRLVLGDWIFFEQRFVESVSAVLVSLLEPLPLPPLAVRDSLLNVGNAITKFYYEELA